LGRDPHADHIAACTAAVLMGNIAAEARNYAPYAFKPWAVALYVGPASPKYIGAVLQDFNLQSKEYMVGLAIDRWLFRLWPNFYVSSEI
jgi:hypothetical protein